MSPPPSIRIVNDCTSEFGHGDTWYSPKPLNSVYPPVPKPGPGLRSRSTGWTQMRPDRGFLGTTNDTGPDWDFFGGTTNDTGQGRVLWGIQQCPNNGALWALYGNRIVMISHPHPKDAVLRDLLISVDTCEKINEELKNPIVWTCLRSRIWGCSDIQVWTLKDESTRSVQDVKSETLLMQESRSRND